METLIRLWNWLWEIFWLNSTHIVRNDLADTLDQDWLSLQIESPDFLISLKACLKKKIRERILYAWKWLMKVDWWVITVWCKYDWNEWEFKNEIDNLIIINIKKINIWDEKISIIWFELSWIKYTAVEVPQSLRNMPLNQMSLWNKFENLWDSWNCPNIDFSKPFWERWIIEETENHKWDDWDVILGIKCKRPLTWFDFQKKNIMETLTKLWVVWQISFSQSIVLFELLQRWLWSLNPNFTDINWEESFSWERELNFKRILGLIWINFWGKASFNVWDEYLHWFVYNAWIYIWNDWKIHYFVRWASDDANWIYWWVFSFRLLDIDPTHRMYFIWFRGSL